MRVHRQRGEDPRIARADAVGATQALKGTVRQQLVDLIGDGDRGERYFAGMEHAEAARALGISEITVRRHWKYARAWLYTELNPGRIGSAVAGENRGRSPG